MIRLRLSIAFALLSVIALAQCLFAWWAASLAARHAERSVIAAGLLAHYESLAGNKQRLKVWFAEAMLGGEAPAEVRDALMGRMASSVQAMRALAARDALERGTISPESGFIDLLELNVQTFTRAIRANAQPSLPSTGSRSEQWRTVITAFDELSGRDIRVLIRAAVERQEAAAAQESRELSRALELARRANFWLAIVVILASIVAVLYFISKLQRPIAQLTRVSARFAEGDLNARVDLRGSDEFSRIGMLLDSMAERLSLAQRRDAQVQQSLDALVAVRTRAVTHAHESMLRVEARRRQFFAEVSHELRTPVTVIRGEAEIALRRQDSSPNELRLSLQNIAEAASDLAGRVQDLLDAARSGSIDYAFAVQVLDLRTVVTQAVAQMQAVAAYRGLRLRLEESPLRPGSESSQALPGQSFPVRGDPDRLQQALVIVLDNALRYSPEGSTVRLQVHTEHDWQHVTVDDQGPGLSDADIERAFEPHFRGDGARQLHPDGAGLGLSIAQRILLAHRGSIELCRNAEGGTRVVLMLPCADEQPLLEGDSTDGSSAHESVQPIESPVPVKHLEASR